MKSSQIMIAIAAMLMAASFAGIVAIDDEADAVDAEDITAVAYSDGVNSRVVAVTGATITLMDAFGDDAAFGAVTEGSKTLKYWVSNSGISYPAGTEIQITNINASDVVDGRFVLTAVYNATTVDFIVDGKVMENGDITPVEDKVTAPADPKKEGYTFLGWKWSAAPAENIDKIYTKAEVDELDVDAGQTFTAVFQEIFDIYWVVDGNIIAHGTTAIIEDTDGDVMNLGKPIDPVKKNHAFIGWFDTDNVKYTVDDPDTKDVDESYKFTKDTTFTAKFEADLVTVIFMVGDDKFDSIEVRYGGTASKVALPEGYAYWAVQTKAPVYAEDGVTVVTPAEYAEYDFSKAVTSALTLYAIAAEAPEPDESIYATFNIEGTIYGPYKVTDRFSIPQTDREGYNFLLSLPHPRSPASSRPHRARPSRSSSSSSSSCSSQPSI